MLLAEVFDEIPIRDGGRAAVLQPERNLADDESLLVFLLEAALAICKSAFRLRQPHGLLLQAVHRVDPLDDGSDLLPVRADVLHRRAADAAWNSGQTFDAGEVPADRERDEAVPRLAGASNDDRVVATIACLHAADLHLQHEPVQPAT